MDIGHSEHGEERDVIQCDNELLEFTVLYVTLGCNRGAQPLAADLAPCDLEQLAEP